MTASAWLEANAVLIPHQVAGLTLLGVGAWLLGFHARVASTRHFAGFLLGYGAAIVLSSIASSQSGTILDLRATAAVAFFYCATALLLCVLAFPRSVVPAVESAWATLIPAGVAVVSAAAILAAGGTAAGFEYAPGIGNAIVACAVAVAFVRLGHEPPGEARRSLLLLTIGVSLQETYFTTFSVALVALGTSPYSLDALILWGNVAALLILLAGASVLVLRVRTKDPETARMARLALGTIPLGAGTGVLSALFATNPWVVNLGGVWRLLFAGLVTWGILRHQFLGVDLRVRWAIGRSTVAAVFVAVFFVASEAAQQFLGETTGSQYLGIAAAGALVFAIVPLQRAATRLAERAVPTDASPANATAAGISSESDTDMRARADAYRNAVRLALGNRALTRDEELQLHELAEQLGVSGRHAHAILAEVEREAGGGER